MDVTAVVVVGVGETGLEDISRGIYTGIIDMIGWSGHFVIDMFNKLGKDISFHSHGVRS